jgi:hypothetical protein
MTQEKMTNDVSSTGQNWRGRMKTRGVLLGVAVLGMVGTAEAQHPHFVGRVTATLTGENAALVCWKEAGLGNNQLVDYTASADAIVTFVCVNHGGQCPNAANKQSSSGLVTATGTFDSGQNGQITQCLLILAPGIAPFCPNGQTETLDLLSFSNFQIHDDTNDVTKTAGPASFTVNPFDCPE